MEILIRNVTQRDCELASDWIHERGETPWEWAYLPKTGIVCEINGVPAAMGWVFFTNSATAFLHNVVSNPHLLASRRAVALRAGLAAILEIAEGCGVGLLMGDVRVGKMARFVRRVGGVVDVRPRLAVGFLLGGKLEKKG